MSTFHQKERTRRAKMSPQSIALYCCSAYLTPAGYWQADQNYEDCVRQAILLGTFKVRHAQKPEDFFNLVPPVEVSVRGAESQLATFFRSLAKDPSPYYDLDSICYL